MAKVIDIVGLRKIINEMPQVYSHKVLGSAIYAAVGPMVEDMKGRVNIKTGRLERSIGRTRQPLTTAKVLGHVKVGPRIKGEFKGNHGYNVEEGHRVVLGGSLPASLTRSGRQHYAKNPARTGKGKVVGKANPHPFFKPAVDANIDKAGVMVWKKIDQSLGRLVKKYSKGYRIAV